MQIITKTNEESSALNIYKFKNMLNEAEINAWLKLDEVLGTKLDLMKASTPEFKQFVLALVIQEPPQTTFIVKEGILKRDPGFMKSWKDVICIITTEGFFHGFNSKSEKDPIFTLNCRKVVINPKKDTRFELSEEKKGIFSSNTKINFKATTLIEMEDWIKALNTFN